MESSEKEAGKSTPFPLPVIFSNGGKWVEAWCPVIDVATQGRNHEEAEKNIKELIEWYFDDKDTPKPKLNSLMSLSVSVSTVPINIKGVSHSQAPSDVCA